MYYNIFFLFRFVAFDSLGHKLITGISINNSNPASLLNSNSYAGMPYMPHNNNNNNNQGDNNDHHPHPHPPPPPPPPQPNEATRERLVQSYENLMNQYRQLLADAPIPAPTVTFFKIIIILIYQLVINYILYYRLIVAQIRWRLTTCIIFHT